MDTQLKAAIEAFQKQANDLLTAAGYAGLSAQVSASILPTGFSYTVSASNPATVFHDNLSFGIATTPDAALSQFAARLVPAMALNASLTEMRNAA